MTIPSFLPSDTIFLAQFLTKLATSLTIVLKHWSQSCEFVSLRMAIWKAGELYCILVLAHQLHALNSQQLYTLTRTVLVCSMPSC